MKVRVLSKNEWQRLQNSELPFYAGLVPSGQAKVIVAEEDGKIVGGLTVFSAMHFEGMWVAPQHRNAGMIRGLLRRAVAAAHGAGQHFVFATADDDRMAGVMERLRGTKVPSATYVLPVGG